MTHNQNIPCSGDGPCHWDATWWGGEAFKWEEWMRVEGATFDCCAYDGKVYATYLWQDGTFDAGNGPWSCCGYGLCELNCLNET